MAQINYNSEQHQFFTGFTPVPAGKYPVVIDDAIVERTKDQASGLLRVMFKVLPGHEAAGRTFPYRLNLWNTSAEAVEMAFKQLKTLMYAIGLPPGPLGDTDRVKGGQCVVDVTVNGEYNNIKAVLDRQGNAPGAGSPVQGQPGQPGMPSFPGQPPAPQGMPQPLQMPPNAMPAGFTPQPQAQQPPPNPFAAPVQAPPPPAPVADPSASWQRSPDGAYKLNPATNAWEANTAPPAQYQPQAQQPNNPSAGFTPQPQQGAPNGWPQ